MKVALHVGSGGDTLPPWLSQYSEVRQDIDPRHKPDILGSMCALGDVGPFDLVYSSHCLEHLYPHEVGKALREFRRVLKPDGHAVIFVPDLEDVKATEDVVFVSPQGPITGMDLLFGYRPVLAERPHMAHHTGFTEASLRKEMELAGFSHIETKRLGACNLMAAARR